MTKEKVGESFGLIADPSSKLNQKASVRAVRATGEVFDLLLTITKVTHNIITASLRDATAPDAIQPPHTVSSASASYQDSLSSYQSTLSHLYSGLVVDVNELNGDAGEWVGTGRFAAGMEEISGVGADAAFDPQDKANNVVSAVSLTAFSDLRRALESGVILLDVEANSLSEVANLLLDEAEMKGLSTPEIREPVLRLFDMPETSLLQP